MRPSHCLAAAFAVPLLFLAIFPAMACQPFGEGVSLQDGVYCLTADVGLSNSSLLLRDNATLDCRGHRIRDLTGSTNYGVLVRGENVALENCVFDGFEIAVNFSSATNYRIRNNVTINARFRAMVANGRRGSITGNVVRAPAMAGDWVGIVFSGDADVLGNTVILGRYSPVDELRGRNGIVWNRGDSALIAFNDIQAVASDAEEGVGIETIGAGAVIYRNTITVTPGSNRIGIACWGSVSLQNVVQGMPTPYSECEPYYDTGVGLRSAIRSLIDRPVARTLTTQDAQSTFQNQAQKSGRAYMNDSPQINNQACGGGQDPPP